MLASQCECARPVQARCVGDRTAAGPWQPVAAGKVDADTNRPTARPASPKPSNSKPIASGSRSPPPAGPRVKGIVYVVDGHVARIRGIDPNGTWQEDDRGFADVPVTRPLTDVEIAEGFPTLGLRLGADRPHVRGKIREYLPR
jgi:hypothetical protein